MCLCIRCRLVSVLRSCVCMCADSVIPRIVLACLCDRKQKILAKQTRVCRCAHMCTSNVQFRARTRIRRTKVYCWHVHSSSAVRFSPFLSSLFPKLSYLLISFLSLWFCFKFVFAWKEKRIIFLLFLLECGQWQCDWWPNFWSYFMFMFLTDILCGCTCMAYEQYMFADAFLLYIRLQTPIYAMWACTWMTHQTETEPNNKKKECRRVCRLSFFRTVCFQTIFPFRSLSHNFQHHISNCAVNCIVPSFPKKKYGFCRFMWYFFGKKILATKLLLLKTVCCVRM